MPKIKRRDQPLIRNRQAWEQAVRCRVRTVLYTAWRNGYRNLVLGAWGAGAFRNPGGWVARIFATELASREWRGCFEVVVFAITVPKLSDEPGGFPGELAPLPAHPEVVDM